MTDIEKLKQKLQEVEAQIKRHSPNDSYFDSLSSSFHLGMVGGSGRNTYRLNKRRERAIDKSIDAAKILSSLYTQRDNLKKQIEEIENGTAAKREETVMSRRIKAAEYWRTIKAGDEVKLFTGNTVTVKKKNRLSIESELSKYTASEIIGREAAKLI